MKLQLRIFLLLGESSLAKLKFISQNAKCKPLIRMLKELTVLLNLEINNSIGKLNTRSSSFAWSSGSHPIKQKCRNCVSTRTQRINVSFKNKKLNISGLPREKISPSNIPWGKVQYNTLWPMQYDGRWVVCVPTRSWWCDGAEKSHLIAFYLLTNQMDKLEKNSYPKTYFLCLFTESNQI